MHLPTSLPFLSLQMERVLELKRQLISLFEQPKGRPTKGNAIAIDDKTEAQATEAPLDKVRVS